MSELYASTTTLRAGSSEVCAFVQVDTTRPARPKCLLLHGNPSCLGDFERLVPGLSQIADIAAFDFPGFGRTARTDRSSAALSLDRLAELSVAVADALGWHQPIYLVGHSHGGGVAQVVAAHYPARVAGLVLLATLGTPAHPELWLTSLPGAEISVKFWRWVLRSPRHRPWFARLLARAMKVIASPDEMPVERVERELAIFAARSEILLSIVHASRGKPCERLFRCAPLIRCPVLFLHGAKDALLPPQYARNIHERIIQAGGHSEFRLIPNAGHMLPEFQAAVVVENIARMLGARPV
jgi:pimeloyl-ACP methyl ester carboxylesterase